MENYGTMEKLWYYGKTYDTKKNYDTIPKTLELWFTLEKQWYYSKLSKLYLTLVKL